MNWGVIIIAISVIIAGIWLISKWNGMKSKFFAVFVIAIILFLVFSLVMAFKGENLSVQNISDVKEMFQVYFSWLINAFKNMRVITANAIKMDWNSNQTT